MKRLLFFAALALALVWVMRALEYAGVRRCTVPEFVKLRRTFLEPNPADLLIVGSSRAACQLVPEQLEQATGLRTWNAGMTGATLPFFATTFEAWLEHNAPPKVLLIQLDLHALDDAADTVFDYPRYFPYLSNAALYVGLRRQDSKFSIYRWLAPYALAQGNTRLLNAGLRGWAGGVAAPTRGYETSVRRGGIGDLDTLTYPTQAPLPSAALLAELDRLLIRCGQLRVQPVLLVSPLYAKRQDALTNYAAVVAQFRAVAALHKVAFIDCSADAVRLNKAFYTDPAHLNRAGAEVFTAHVCDSLVARRSPVANNRAPL